MSNIIRYADDRIYNVDTFDELFRRVKEYINERRNDAYHERVKLNYILQLIENKNRQYSFYSVANEIERLALIYDSDLLDVTVDLFVREGLIVLQEDTQGLYILIGNDPSLEANWMLLNSLVEETLQVEVENEDSVESTKYVSVRRLWQGLARFLVLNPQTAETTQVVIENSSSVEADKYVSVRRFWQGLDQFLVENPYPIVPAQIEETTQAVVQNELSTESNKYVSVRRFWNGITRFISLQNSSETVKGFVQEATQAQVNTSVDVGSTGAKLFVPPSKLNALFSTNIAGNTLFVNPLNANASDAYTRTQALGRPDKPFLSIQAAEAAAITNDIIIIQANTGNPLLKNNVFYDFSNVLGTTVVDYITNGVVIYNAKNLNIGAGFQATIFNSNIITTRFFPSGGAGLTLYNCTVNLTANNALPIVFAQNTSFNSTTTEFRLFGDNSFYNCIFNKKCKLIAFSGLMNFYNSVLQKIEIDGNNALENPVNLKVKHCDFLTTDSHSVQNLQLRTSVPINYNLTHNSFASANFLSAGANGVILKETLNV